jgi:hypothetical protein
MDCACQATCILFSCKVVPKWYHGDIKVNSITKCKKKRHDDVSHSYIGQKKGHAMSDRGTYSPSSLSHNVTYPLPTPMLLAESVGGKSIRTSS